MSSQTVIQNKNGIAVSVYVCVVSLFSLALPNIMRSDVINTYTCQTSTQATVRFVVDVYIYMQKSAFHPFVLVLLIQLFTISFFLFYLFSYVIITFISKPKTKLSIPSARSQFDNTNVFAKQQIYINLWQGTHPFYCVLSKLVANSLLSIPVAASELIQEP